MIEEDRIACLRGAILSFFIKSWCVRGVWGQGSVVNTFIVTYIFTKIADCRCDWTGPKEEEKHEKITFDWV